MWLNVARQSLLVAGMSPDTIKELNKARKISGMLALRLTNRRCCGYGKYVCGGCVVTKDPIYPIANHILCKEW